MFHSQAGLAWAGRGDAGSPGRTGGVQALKSAAGGTAEGQR